MLLLFILLFSFGLSESETETEPRYFFGVDVSQWRKVRKAEVIFLDYIAAIEDDSTSHKIGGVMLWYEILFKLADEFGIKDPREDPDKPYTGQQFIDKFKILKKEQGRKKFRKNYFGGKRRVKLLRKAIKHLQILTDGEVNIICESYNRRFISPQEWTKYVKYVVNKFLKLEIEESHFITLAEDVDEHSRAMLMDDGMKKYLKSVGKPNAKAILVLASYHNKDLPIGADCMLVGYEGLLKDSIDLLIKRTSGDFELENTEPYFEMNAGVCKNYLHDPEKCEKIATQRGLEWKGQKHNKLFPIGCVIDYTTTPNSMFSNSLPTADHPCDMKQGAACICAPRDCTLPEIPPTGFSFSSPSLSRCTPFECWRPFMFGISCASGYEGKITIMACSTTSSNVLLTGCKLRKQEKVSAPYQTADNSITVFSASAILLTILLFCCTCPIKEHENYSYELLEEI